LHRWLEANCTKDTVTALDQHSLFEAVIQSRQPGQANTPLANVETPLVTVDIVVFTIVDRSIEVLLFERKTEPYAGHWSIPGGFINQGETLEQAAARWLRAKTTVENIYLEQLYAFGGPGRDPRARVITVAYYALVSHEKLTPEGRHNPSDGTQWFSIDNLPSLAFDHNLIVAGALKRLKERLNSSAIAFQLLGDKFTLTELQRVYELVLNKTLDKRNFRKKMLAAGILEEIGETKMEGYHRPAQLYIFKNQPSGDDTLASLQLGDDSL
jgi:8-oxo-dGTP diphosphatase